MPSSDQATQNTHGNWVRPIHMWIVALTLVAAAVAFSRLDMVSANSDYICTKIITTEGTCTGGSWDTWAPVSTETVNGVTTTTERRTYTGTRAVSQELSYLNLRTSCQAGYIQQRAGSGGGASGNQGRGGDIVTQYSACQIVETRSLTTGGGGSSTISIDRLRTDIGSTTQTRERVATVAELDVRAAELSGGAIGVISNDGRSSLLLEAKPALVARGLSTVVSWKTTGLDTCNLTSSNADAWTGLEGTRSSAPIQAQTVFTLSCVASSGATLSASTTVNLIPQFQEQ